MNDSTSAFRGNRGGSWLNFTPSFLSATRRRSGDPNGGLINLGFRVASTISPTGDYGGNGIVDAAEYVVWRNFSGTSAEYNVWRTHFSQSGWKWYCDVGSPPRTAIDNACDPCALGNGNALSQSDLLQSRLVRPPVRGRYLIRPAKC